MNCVATSATSFVVAPSWDAISWYVFNNWYVSLRVLPVTMAWVVSDLSSSVIVDTASRIAFFAVLKAIAYKEICLNALPNERLVLPTAVSILFKFSKVVWADSLLCTIPSLVSEVASCTSAANCSVSFVTGCISAPLSVFSSVACHFSKADVAFSTAFFALSTSSLAAI